MSRRKRSQRRGPPVGRMGFMPQLAPTLIQASGQARINRLQFWGNRVFHSGVPPTVIRLDDQASVDDFDARGNAWVDTSPRDPAGQH